MKGLSRLVTSVAVSVAALWALSAQARVVVSNTASGQNIRVQVEGLSLDEVAVNDGTFLRASVRGADGHNGVLYAEGMPEVPVIRFLVDGDARVVVGPAQRDASRGRGLPLWPNQPSLAKVAGATTRFAINRSFYETDTFYPRDSYRVEPAGTVDGAPRTLVTLIPVSYNSATGEFILRSNFQVTVARQQPLHARATHEAIAFVVGAKFQNSPAIASYQDLKESLGFAVRRVVIGTDTASFEGGAANDPTRKSFANIDPAAGIDIQVRDKLRAIYADSGIALRHVIIFGDYADVPGHTTSIISGLTDHYYSSLDNADYLADINAPDVGVGRISAADEAQMTVILDKLTRYQKGVFGSEDWLKNASFIGTDDKYQVAEATHNYVIDSYAIAQGYTGIFPTNPQAGGDKLYAITHHATGTNVVDALKLGRFLVDYSGHGARTYWAGPEVTQFDVRSLAHPDALPFVISNACITGDYRVEEAFSETWLRHPNGAIAFWGSMDSSYWDEDDILERRMADGIWRDGLRTFADLTHRGLSEVWTFYGGAGRSKYYWETYHVFGDPSIMFRTQPTRVLNVEGPDGLPTGSTSATFRVLAQDGTPVANARVVLRERESLRWVAGITDDNGVATIALEDLGSAPALFTRLVYADNARLATSDFRVIPSDSPYMALSRFSANGRFDGMIFPGENVKITLTARNVGAQETNGVTLSLDNIDGPASIVDGTETLGAVAVNASMELASDAFTIHVDPSAVLGTRVRARLTWLTQEGVTASTSWTMVVSRGVLATKGFDYGLAIPADLGGIAPGSSGDLFVTLTNTGTETLRDIVLQPRGVTCVDSVSGDIQIDSIAPGAILRAPMPLRVAISASCRNGDPAVMRLEGTYQSVATRLPVDAAVNFPAGTVSITTVENPAINQPIPDATGSELSIDLPVDRVGVITDLALRVKITHTYIGDLSVKLVHPDGTVITLWDRQGGASDNMDITFGMGGTANNNIKLVYGKPTQGVWKLQVRDYANQDTGTLDATALTLKGFLN